MSKTSFAVNSGVKKGVKRIAKPQTFETFECSVMYEEEAKNNLFQAKSQSS